MGIYGGIQAAKYTEGGAYIDAGVFRLEIQAVKTVKKRDGTYGMAVELKALEVSGDSKYKPGAFFSWFVNPGDTFLGNVKNFAAVASACYQGITDVDDTQITEEALEAITADAQPLKGIKIRASAVNVKTKRGTDFTKVRWIPDATSMADVEKAHVANK